jgi:hypothetical protein
VRLHTVIHAYSNGLEYSRIAWEIGYETHIYALGQDCGIRVMVWDIQTWPGTLFMRPVFGLGHDYGIGVVIWDIQKLPRTL